MLADLYQADPQWRIACLRYFDPVGAHESGLIGEAPQELPDNLMLYVAQVTAGKREYLNVWSDDYSKIDGTGVRDYIHVCDLVDGHVSSLEYLNRVHGLLTLYMGTGSEYSVLEVVKAFEKFSGRVISDKIGPSKVGNIAMSLADTTLAQQLLDWKTSRCLEQMCADAWRRQGSKLFAI